MCTIARMLENQDTIIAQLNYMRSKVFESDSPNEFLRKQEAKKEISNIAINNGWTCPECGRVNPAYTGTCACGTEKPD